MPVLLLVAVALTGLPGAAALADPGAEGGFVQLINQERTGRGLAPLAAYWNLTDDARAHSNKMAFAGDIWHNPDLAGVTSGWYALAENVGMGPTVPVLHEAFMESSPHRANILGDYNYLGVGVTVDDNGTIFVTVVFMRGPAGLAGFTPPFRDDDGSVHEVDIARIHAAGVTDGCGPELYCPGAPLTRGQMAALLARALGVSGGRNAFVDDDGHAFEAQINALAARGIVKGCASQRFCPDAAISRGEMAALLARAKGISGGGDVFTDDNGHPFEADINALAREGITQGCAAARFCPDDWVSRAQMASFLVRAFALS